MSFQPDVKCELMTSLLFIILTLHQQIGRPRVSATTDPYFHALSVKMALTKKWQTARRMNALKDISRDWGGSSHLPLKLTAVIPHHQLWLLKLPPTTHLLRMPFMLFLFLLPFNQINLTIHLAILTSISTVNPTSWHHTAAGLVLPLEHNLPIMRSSFFQLSSSAVYLIAFSYNANMHICHHLL